MSLPYNVRGIELLRGQRPQSAGLLSMKSKLTWKSQWTTWGAMKRMKKTSLIDEDDDNVNDD